MRSRRAFSLFEVVISLGVLCVVLIFLLTSTQNVIYKIHQTTDKSHFHELEELVRNETKMSIKEAIRSKKVYPIANNHYARIHPSELSLYKSLGLEIEYGRINSDNSLMPIERLTFIKSN